MNRRIVIAIDVDLSPHTQHVLCVASSLLELASPELVAVLLHVIPVPDLPQSKIGMSRIAPTTRQHELAEQALYRARLALQKLGIVPERIELLLRSGIPADEIVKAARELGADFIMIGSRGNSLKQKVRRVLAGSTSRQVIKLGGCPVMIVSLPSIPGPNNLVQRLIWIAALLARGGGGKVSTRRVVVNTTRGLSKEYSCKACFLLPHDPHSIPPMCMTIPVLCSQNKACVSEQANPVSARF
jgi:nucleotide-binding universal stress UspA family protein